MHAPLEAGISPASPPTDAAFYRALVENSWDAMEVLDENGMIVYVGDSTTRVIGYSRDELLGQDGFATMHPDDLPAGRALYASALAAPGRPVIARLRLRHKDGRWRHVEGQLVSHLHDPRIAGMVICYHDTTEILEATARLHEANARLAEMARTDALTGLANRAALEERLAAEWRRCARGGQELSLILLDIDHFKRFNDEYGHLGGDSCLRRVAGAIAAALRRPGDFAARYGGEEFVCLLPEISLAGALEVARRVEGAIGELAIAHRGSATAPRVTVSQGVATAWPAGGGDPEELLASADAALYRAKDAGRNRAFAAEASRGLAIGQSSSRLPCANDDRPHSVGAPHAAAAAALLHATAAGHPLGQPAG